MSKFCITLTVLAIIILSTMALAFPQVQVEKQYLRIHVRANSNQESDQAIKYEVKDEIVSYLTPYIAEITDKQSAIAVLDGLIDGIVQTADEVLANSGYDYSSRAEIKNEKFPTRVYDGLVLDGGYYDALIVYLGSGLGDNWWCVVYPPLCFTTTYVNVEYKSKIVDIINDFFGKEN